MSEELNATIGVFGSVLGVGFAVGVNTEFGLTVSAFNAVSFALQ